MIEEAKGDTNSRKSKIREDTTINPGQNRWSRYLRIPKNKQWQAGQGKRQNAKFH